MATPPETERLLYLDGELGFAALEQRLPRLLEAFRAERPTAIDLSGVSHVDSGTVALLLMLAQMPESGQPLRFSRLPVKLQALIDLYGLGTLFGQPA